MNKHNQQLLPSNPDLKQLKNQAKDLKKIFEKNDPSAIERTQSFHPEFLNTSEDKIKDAELALSDFQLIIAREYSFPSWQKLKRFVETASEHTVTETANQLKLAIDEDDVASVKKLIKKEPELVHEHVLRQQWDYKNQRPLTYASQLGRVDIVKALLDAGADPGADGYLAVARATVSDGNLPITKLFIEYGVDPNVKVHGWGAWLLYPCECLAPDTLEYLLKSGAVPNLVYEDGRCQLTPMEMVLGTYTRSENRHKCINVLITAGVHYDDSPVMDIHRRHLDQLEDRLRNTPSLISEHFDNVDYGDTGDRGMTAKGGTLLHIASEWCETEAVEFLLKYGADVNAKAKVDEHNIGGQTPIFHSVSQYKLSGQGYAITKLLLEAGADLSIKANIYGQASMAGKKDNVGIYDPLEYAEAFPSQEKFRDQRIVDLLVKHKNRVELL